MKQNHYLNSFFLLFLRVSTFFVLALLLNACEKSTTDKSTLVPNVEEPVQSYILFKDAQEWNVTITRVRDGSTVLEKKTAENGSFTVDINSSFLAEDLVKIEVKTLELQSYATVKELQEEGVILSALTTLATLELNETQESLLEDFSLYAKKIFRSSLTEDALIDYRDINSYKPSMQRDTHFINPELYSDMNESGFLDAIENGDDLQRFIAKDSDGDTLSWEREVLLGTDIFSTDSDQDSLSDDKELALGLNPLLRDSDFDTLLDAEELELLSDPLQSDTDGDYYSDGYEVAHSMDPLNADENSNGIVDGLEGDPLFKYQWYLKSEGTVVSNTNGVATIVGNDLNILDVYRYQRGDINHTLVQVVDTGVELAHEDLIIDLEHSLNSITGRQDPTATKQVSSYDKVSPFEIGHGTAVAGIIGAINNNDVGVRGVVPHVKIAGSNWLEEQSLSELERLWYSGVGANDILVSNNSWGTYMIKDRGFEDILQLASEQLRDAKGRLFVFASGNDRESYGNANLSYVANNRYAITVASLNYKNQYSYYSNPGSNVLVSAYGGGSYDESPTIATTLLMGESYYESELGNEKGAITFDDDLERNYTFAMNGTSAATPMVSGVLALVLESCPELSWRDVKWLLSYTSKKIDPENEKWIENGAKRTHNVNYGFGLIDANRMIEECRSPYYTLLGEEREALVELPKLNLYIPDTNTTKSIYVKMEESMTIEWVELTVDSDHPYVGDYEIILISPSGTKTEIITPNELRSNYYSGGFRFSSAAFIGEESEGSWQVEITDRLHLDSGTIYSVSLHIYGH